MGHLGLWLVHVGRADPGRGALYFAGNISFGGLMLASGAFNQVQSSLRWFVDNFSTIADWRATLLRVASFRRAVINTDVLHDVESRITFDEGRPAGSPSIQMLIYHIRPEIPTLQEPRMVHGGGAHLWSWAVGSGKRCCSAASRACGPGGRPHHPSQGRRDSVPSPHTPTCPGHLREFSHTPLSPEHSTPHSNLRWTGSIWDVWRRCWM